MKEFSLHLLALLAFAPAAFAQEPTAQPAAPAAAKVERTYAAQTTCPVSGEALENRDHFVEHQGHRIYTCCDKCVTKVAAFPDYFVFKMALEGVAPENVQTTCPVSGEALESRDHFVPVGNQRIYVCCEKCVKKVQSNPARAMDTLSGRKPQESCPVSGKTLTTADGLEFQGVFIKTCCGECPTKFKAEPEKYLKAMAARKEYAEQKEPICPVHANEKVKDRTFFTTAGPLRYYFGSKECMAQFMRDPAKYAPALRGWVPAQKKPEASPASQPKEPAGQPGR